MIVVDRFEGAYAVCLDDDKKQDIPIKSLPENVSEGDVLTLTDNGYEIDKNATDERRRKIIALQNSLWE